MTFNTTLLREKFVIQDPQESNPAASIVAVSNRIVVPLINSTGQLEETYVVRAQTMHDSLRMAVQLLSAFQKGGSLAIRKPPFRFDAAWKKARYEMPGFPSSALWVAIYKDGQVVYKSGEPHPFLDVIEKCDATSKESYEKSVKLAEKAFSQLGKEVKITHDANIALVMTITDDVAKCGVILRDALKQATFNFQVEKSADAKEDVAPAACLNACAAYLEAIQLSFRVGMSQVRKEYELFAAGSDEAKRLMQDRKRVTDLTTDITVFENLYDVHYRPDKPNFRNLSDQAERLTRRQIEESGKIRY
ncbi:MAG: hypothetical protein AB7E85_01910 [Pseudobdellovibrionaceae bacterium]